MSTGWGPNINTSKCVSSITPTSNYHGPHKLNFSLSYMSCSMLSFVTRCRHWHKVVPRCSGPQLGIFDCPVGWRHGRTRRVLQFSRKAPGRDRWERCSQMSFGIKRLSLPYLPAPARFRVVPWVVRLAQQGLRLKSTVYTIPASARARVRTCANGATTRRTCHRCRAWGGWNPSPRNLRKCRVPVSEDEDEDDHRYFEVQGGTRLVYRRCRLQTGAFVRAASWGLLTC